MLQKEDEAGNKVENISSTLGCGGTKGNRRRPKWIKHGGVF